MNRSITFILVTTILLLPALVFAGPFDMLKKGDDSKGGAKVDVNGLSGRATTLIVKVAKATISFGEAVVEIQYAVGKAASAEKLKAAIDNAKAKKDDTDNIKALVGEVNNAVNEMNKVDLNSQIDLTKARVSMGKSILNFGVGVIMDMGAVSDAKTLMAEATNALKTVQAAPTQYGPAAVKNVQSVITSSQFVVENIPPQANSIQIFSGKLMDYAKTNKIELPSQAEIDKKAKDMEKE